MAASVHAPAPALAHPNHRPAATLPVELRRTGVPPEARAWVGRAVGSPVVSVRRLAGASSTAVHLLALRGGRRLVLRRYAWPGFQADEPFAAQREVDGLRWAGSHGLSVPEVVASDPTGDDVGDGVAALLMTRLPGTALAHPDLRAMAETAAAIHSTPADRLGHDYFPWYRTTVSSPPPAARQPRLWDRAIAHWHSSMPQYRPMLLHRDFHPGNVLWSRGRLGGVVDWVNACRGPAGCDLAHCCWNLRRLHGGGDDGEHAAGRFLGAYESVTGETLHPYWELASTLEHGPHHWTDATVADAEPRLARILADLGV